MTSQPFSFEIHDLVASFVAAFDRAVVNRYDKNRDIKGTVDVRYVYAPKQRVLYDIVNKAQNITLPCVSISIGSVTRATDRVFNKIKGIDYPKDSLSVTNMRMPVPVDISINMSIITKFQLDMDQILESFMPYTNPYIILSWKIPSKFTENNEIRSEVLWSNSISVKYPTELASSAKSHIVADTSFTIKGWIFPAVSQDTSKIIYNIESNFHDLSEYEPTTYTNNVSSGLLTRNKGNRFHFEVKDLVSSFVGAFDNIVINRYNRDREQQGQVQVRCVYSPKQRVLYDIANKAQNVTLPCVAINMGSFTRAEDRVFNKIPGLTFPRQQPSDTNGFFATSRYMRMPIPVDISVSMSIIAKYQADIDQILSNFIAYTNPYIILSWKIPKEFGLAQNYEIRSEVLWSGSVNLNYPIELAANAKSHITGETTFTIKGWIFPEVPSDVVKNIYYIDANFHSTGNTITLSATNYNSLSTETFIYPASSFNYNDLETVSIYGVPETGEINSHILAFPDPKYRGFNLWDHADNLYRPITILNRSISVGDEFVTDNEDLGGPIYLYINLWDVGFGEYRGLRVFGHSFEIADFTISDAPNFKELLIWDRGAGTFRRVDMEYGLLRVSN